MTTIGDLSRELSARAESVCRALFAGRVVGREYVALPTRQGGHGDSLRVVIAGDKRGLWAHFAAGDDARGDMIDLVAYIRRCSKREAADWSREFLALPDDRRPVAIAGPAPAAPETSEAGSIERAAKLWNEARPIRDTLGETYLSGRGIASLDYPNSLRFHPALWHFKAACRFPAIVARIDAPDGTFAGVWRIFLARDGSAKAPVEDPRLGLGRMRAGAVRLAPARDCLALSEGIETGLAFSRRQSWPVWAGLATSNLANVASALPACVRALVVAGDNDAPKPKPGGGTFRPGQEAAERAAAVARARGIAATTIFPGRVDHDFNDPAIMAARHG